MAVIAPNAADVGPLAKDMIATLPIGAHSLAISFPRESREAHPVQVSLCNACADCRPGGLHLVILAGLHRAAQVVFKGPPLPSGERFGSVVGRLISFPKLDGVVTTILLD